MFQQQFYSGQNNPYTQERQAMGFHDPRQGMNGNRPVYYPPSYEPQPPKQVYSREASIKKAQSARNPPSSFDGSGPMLDPVALEEIRAIKDDLAYIERDLAYNFKGIMKVVPYYKQNQPLPAPEKKSSKAPKNSLPPKEPKEKKVNKYVQNFLDKYDQPQLNMTQPPPAPRPAPKSSQPQDRELAKTLPKAAQARVDDSISFFGDKNDGYSQDDGGSLRVSQMSHASTQSKRRESFEKFKRNYFPSQQQAPVEDLAKKFTRTGLKREIQ